MNPEKNSKYDPQNDHITHTYLLILLLLLLLRLLLLLLLLLRTRQSPTPDSVSAPYPVPYAPSSAVLPPTPASTPAVHADSASRLLTL